MAILGFKEGDTVRIKKDCCGTKAGKTYVLQYGSRNGSFMSCLYALDESITDDCGCCCQHNWELVTATTATPEFSVGDRVEYIGKEYSHLKRFTGTVVGYLGTIANVVKVDWDEYTRGHNCDGKARDGHGWNVKIKEIRLLGRKVNKGEAKRYFKRKIIKQKNMLQVLTSKLKRLFNPNLRKQYRAGLINECGDLTCLGQEELNEIVRDTHEEALVEIAEGIIKEEEKKNK